MKLHPSLVLITLALIGALRFPAYAQNEQVLDKVVAVIGNEIITLSELEVQLALYNRRTPIDVNDPVMRKQVLDAMISDKLILAQATLDSIQVSEERITNQIESQLKYMEQQYGSRERLEKEAGMTIVQMKREFREDVRKRIMIEELQNTKFGDISVTRREVTDFYFRYRDSLPEVPEQVELRQIAIFPKVLETFKENTLKRAQTVLDSIRAGADFDEMAKHHSDDAGNAQNGGYLGMARRGVFVKEFEEAVFALKPGEVSGVVETPFGFHIIKLKDRKGDAVEAQHILFRIRKTGESDDAAISTLADVRKRILAGEKFEGLARKYSEDEPTKTVGGSLGVVEVQRLSKEVLDIIKNLNPGDITEPVKIPLGKDYAYALVQMQRRIAPHAPLLEEDYARIELFAKNLKQRKEYDNWLEELRKNVYWKTYL